MKSTMIPPVGVGFKSFEPIGVVGFRITTACPSAGRLDRFLFGKELRPFVVADHLVDQDRRRLIDDRRILAKAHRRHARRIDEARHFLFTRDPEQISRTIDIRGVHCHRIADPKPVVGSHMHHRIAIRKRCAERFGLAKIASYSLSGYPFQIFKAAGLAH